MQDAPQANPKKLFVGNLPYSATEESVVNLFSEYGQIEEAKLIIDRMSGRSKGIAFVTFATEEEANAAIEALNGYEMEGRGLVVNVARPMVPRDNRGGGGFGGGSRDNRGGGNRGYARRGR